MSWIGWIEWLAKVVGALGTGAGVLIAAINYRNQTRIKRAEWIKSLFEKFFENPTYKEVRGWLDYGMLGRMVSAAGADAADQAQKEKDEKFTDFLNLFEFIGVLYSNDQLTKKQVCDVFDYYLKKIRSDSTCAAWIDEYGFKNLKALLALV